MAGGNALFNSFLKSAEAIVTHFGDDKVERDRLLQNLKDIIEKNLMHDEKVRKVRDTIGELTRNIEDVENPDEILESFLEKKQELLDYTPDLSGNANLQDYCNQVKDIIEVADGTKKNNLLDDDIEMTEQEINVMDPFTKKRMTDPVKNRLCGHVYDRDSVTAILKLNKNTRCPVIGCSNKDPILLENILSDIATRRTSCSFNGNFIIHWTSGSYCIWQRGYAQISRTNETAEDTSSNESHLVSERIDSFADVRITDERRWTRVIQAHENVSRLSVPTSSRRRLLSHIYYDSEIESETRSESRAFVSNANPKSTVLETKEDYQEPEDYEELDDEPDEEEILDYDETPVTEPFTTGVDDDDDDDDDDGDVGAEEFVDYSSVGGGMPSSKLLCSLVFSTALGCIYD